MVAWLDLLFNQPAKSLPFCQARNYFVLNLATCDMLSWGACSCFIHSYPIQKVCMSSRVWCLPSFLPSFLPSSLLHPEASNFLWRFSSSLSPLLLSLTHPLSHSFRSNNGINHSCVPTKRPITRLPFPALKFMSVSRGTQKGWLSVLDRPTYHANSDARINKRQQLTMKCR